MAGEAKTKKKLNSIDIIIIVVLALAVCAVGVKVVVDKVFDRSQYYYITFFCEETPDFVPPKVSVGGVMTDESGYVEMGVVTSIDVGPSASYATDDEGKIHLTSREGYCSATITGIVKGVPFDNGILIGGNRYTTGHTMTLRAGEGKFYLRISDIVPATEEQVANEPALKLAAKD
jgi:hypothetical protein